MDFCQHSCAAFVYFIGVFVLCISESEKRLRRNLKKTKALLADAGTMLAKQKNIEGAKQQIAQLRNQVKSMCACLCLCVCVCVHLCLCLCVCLCLHACARGIQSATDKKN